MALFRILPDVTRSRLFKMAAVKPEELISQLLNKIATPFQRELPFSGPSNSMALLRILHDVTESRYFKMAAAKPEVLIHQLLDKMATAAILNYRLPVTSRCIRNNDTELLDHENEEATVGMALLSCLEAAI